jgi:hypothetical protein
MKKKLTMLIGKKQFVLASLVLVLSAAIYLNWQFASTNTAIDVAAETDGKNYGDALLVEGQADYFASARLDKQKSRDNATETIANILGDKNVTNEEKANATAKALELAALADKESKIESLVKAKGFAECIAYTDNGKVNVVVKTEGLDSAGAAQIKDIIVAQTSATPENITITEVK